MAAGLAPFQYVQPGVSQPSLVQPCYNKLSLIPGGGGGGGTPIYRLYKYVFEYPTVYR